LTQTSDIPEGIPYRAEVFRKTLHVLAIVVPIGMQVLGKEVSVALLALLAVLAVLADIARVRSLSFSRFIQACFGGMMRPAEWPRPGDPFLLNGATWLLISACLLALIFPMYLAVRALAMGILGDAAAALVGRRFGRRRLGKSPKTIEGALAFFVAAALSLGVMQSLAHYEIILAAVVGSMMEATPLPVNDNLRVPLFVAFTLFYTQRFLENMPIHLFF
jgi:dolichol kinase